MDIDKPSQLELLREDLEKQQTQVEVKPKRVVKRTVKKPANSKTAAKTVKKSTSRTKKKDVAVAAKAKLKVEK